MQYVVINKLKQAQEILLNEDPMFPGIPLEDRYSAEFLAECLVLPDTVEVIFGWEWDEETETFVEPEKPEYVPEPEPPVEKPIEEEGE